MNPTRRQWLGCSASLAFAGATAFTRRAFAQAAGAPMHAPVQPPSFGNPVNGLRLGLQWIDNFTMAFVLENVSRAPITVLSHVNAGQHHFDWFELRIESATHTAPPRVLGFVETRHAAVIARETIAPGAQLTQRFDTRYWGHSSSNSAPPGWHGSPTYLLSAVYDTSRVHDATVWRGRLESGAISSWIDLA